MDRRWRGPHGFRKFKTALSYFRFKAAVPPLSLPTEEDWLASHSDLYSVYSNLHAVGRSCHVERSADRSMHYVLTNNPTTEEGQAADGSLLHDPDVDTAKLHEVVVPISTACQRLTPGLLHSFFQLHAAGRECVMLALVDSDGTVAVNRMHLGIVAPLEGPSDAQGFGPMQQKKLRQKHLQAQQEAREQEEKTRKTKVQMNTSEHFEEQRRQAAMERALELERFGEQQAEASRKALRRAEKQKRKADKAAAKAARKRHRVAAAEGGVAAAGDDGAAEPQQGIAAGQQEAATPPGFQLEPDGAASALAAEAAEADAGLAEQSPESALPLLLGNVLQSSEGVEQDISIRTSSSPDADAAVASDDADMLLRDLASQRASQEPLGSKGPLAESPEQPSASLAEHMLRQGRLQDADQLMAAARARMAQCSDCGVDVSPQVEVLQAPRPEKVLPGGAALIGLGVVTAVFAGPLLAVVLAITMTLGAVITSLFTFGVFLVPLVALGAFSVGGLGLVLLFFQPLVGALALGACASSRHTPKGSSDSIRV
eukprot:jgi/Astpho2/8683/fgenesh1_pg.00128_%23_4_t